MSDQSNAAANDDLGRLIARNDEAAAKLVPGCDRTRRRLEKDPTDPLPTVRIGRRVFYPEKPVRAWLMRRMQVDERRVA